MLKNNCSVSRSSSVGFYVDQGKVIAVNNPDYNVERTEVISSGKQSDLGLNLSKRSSGGHKDHLARPDIDLTDWVGHRVLAAKGDIYSAGVIRHVTRDTCDVTVMLDGETQTSVYRDVLSDTGARVISDVTPASDQVSVGSKFCVLLDRQRNIFVEALVYEISRCHQGQTEFLVKLRAGGEDKTWVRRSQLRLTSPPWAEELAAAQLKLEAAASGEEQSGHHKTEPPEISGHFQKLNILATLYCIILDVTFIFVKLYLHKKSILKVNIALLCRWLAQSDLATDTSHIHHYNPLW